MPIKKTIGLDLRALDSNFKAHAQRGTGRYVRELTSRLLKLELDDFNFIPLTRENLDLKSWQLEFLNKLPRGKVTFESQICLRKNIKDANCDLAHFFSHGDAPAYPLVPQVVTILDLIPLKFPELYQTKDLNFRYKLARFLENRSALSASGIIAISEATKRDVVDILKIPESRVAVTYLGVDESFLNQTDLSDQDKNEVKLKHNLPLLADLGLYIGGLDARKNIEFLIEIVSELNLSDGNFHLAIVGEHSKEKAFKKIEALIKQKKLEDKISFLGFVDSESLLKLYKTADIFVFPSLYEGFGLPVLEAMASETLVVAGNNSCMPEVMADKDFLFKDNDLNAWVLGIRGFLQQRKSGSTTLVERLKENKKRALGFSWDRTAISTIEAYKGLVNNG